MGAGRWSPDIARIVDWTGGRYSSAAQRQWMRVHRAVGDAIWHFPHWDVPWYSLPQRFVVLVHDLGHFEPGVVAWHRRLVARPWIARAVGAASRVASVSEFTRNALLQRWPSLRNRVDVIRNGVDPYFFDASGHATSRLDAILRGQRFMLSVGNLKRHKNLVMGPEVLARIQGLRWLVVGEWYKDWQLVERRAEQLGVGDRIVVLGRLSDEDIRALYRDAVCVLFPSRYEGFGLPIVEALASGTPVVASDHPAVVETLGDAGWTCGADSPEQFAAAVKEAIGGRANVQARAIARARSFSWNESAARLAATINRVAEDS